MKEDEVVFDENFDTEARVRWFRERLWEEGWEGRLRVAITD